jgi:hypothetical protein
MRVRLIYTDDQYTKLKNGDLGTLIEKHTDPWGAVISEIKWDNGSSLSLIDGIDKYETVTENED